MTAEPALILRKATLADKLALGRLGALLVALHHEFDPQRFIAPTPRTEEAYGDFLVRQSERADVVVLVVEQAGAVLGYVYAGVEGPDWMALRGPAGAVYDLVVDPAHRHQGLGAKLLEAAVATLQVKGAPRVVLSTAQGNHAAQRLFASSGFRPTMIEMTRETPKEG